MTEEQFKQLLATGSVQDILLEKTAAIEAAQAIQKAAEAEGRGTSASQEAKIDENLSRAERCNERLTEIKSELHAREARTRASINFGGGRPLLDPMAGTGMPGTASAAPPRATWRDAAGNPVAVLSRNDSLASAYRASGYVSEDGTDPTESLGDVLRARLTGGSPEIAAASGVGNQTDSGFALSPQVSARVIELSRNKAAALDAGAQVVDMTTSEMTLVREDKDPTPAWTGENKPLPTTSHSLGRLRLRARKMGCIIKFSRELAEDAPNAGEVIERMLSAAMALEFDRAALLGGAKGEELNGLFNIDGTNEEATVGSLTYDKFLDAIKKIEDANGAPNAIIYTPHAKTVLSKLKDSTGQYLAPPEAFTSLSRFSTKQIADTQACVGDFRQMLVGIRRGVRIETTVVAGDSFKDDQVWMKTTWRGDVAFLKPSHFTKLTGIS